MKYTLIIILIFIINTLTFGQFTKIDSIVDFKITDLKLNDTCLYYCTKDGSIAMYNLKHKETYFSVNTFDNIINLDINEKYVGAVSGNMLLLLDKKSNLIQRIYDTKELYAVAFSENNIFFGGKSGILSKYKINKNKKTVFYTTRDSTETYWITDICTNDNKVIFCAGDLYITSLKNNNLIYKDTDKYKGYLSCATHNNVIIASNIKRNNIVLIDEENNKEIIYDKFSYLLKFINDSLIIIAPENQTFIYDIKNKEIISYFSENESAISADYNNDIFFINYYNKIDFYDEEKLSLNKPITLKDINFNVDTTTFKNINLVETELNKINQFYNKNQKDILIIKIVGHTDGHSEKLLQLSEDRANIVKQELISKGIEKSLLIAIGVGGIYPINTSDKDYWKNRRVVIEFITKKTLLDRINEINRDTIITHINNIEHDIYLKFDTLFKKLPENKYSIQILDDFDNIIFFRMPLWSIQNYQGHNYTEIINDSVYIKKSVYARSEPGLKNQKRVLKLNSDMKFQYAETYTDKKNNKWFKFFIYGFYIDDKKSGYH